MLPDKCLGDSVTVTFDRNVYEGILNPLKIGLDDSSRQAAVLIAGFIESGQIIPFISETVFTLETLTNRDGQRRSTFLAKENLQSISNGNELTIGSDPAVYPGMPAQDEHYLQLAVSGGFKLLPHFRFGRLLNPAIEKEWRYIRPEEHYMELPTMFGEVVEFIEQRGGGFSFMKDLLQIRESSGQPWTFYAKQYTGPEKRFNEAIAEWSDGDSVAIHIASHLDYFCTKDTASNAGARSVFGPAIKSALAEKYGVRIVSPEQLITIMEAC